MNLLTLGNTLMQPRLVSGYEVNLVNDSMQEFYVKFKGPDDSKYSLEYNYDIFFTFLCFLDC